MLRPVLFLVALGSGAISAWLVAATPVQQSSPAAAANPGPEVRLERVLVSTVEAEQGSVLLAGNVRWQPWPAEALNQGFITWSKQPEAPTEIAGSVLRVNVLPGEPIFGAKLAAPGSNYLSAALAAGMRAVAISISAERTAGGFVLPNDRVDVMQAVACPPEGSCKGPMTVRTVLQNVRVLAIDRTVQNPDGGLVGKTATLEVNPDQAELLIAAQASGVLSLVLRSAADHDQLREAQPEAKDTVRIWRSGVGEYVTFQ